MAFVLNLLEDLKNWVIIGNACGIEVRSVRQARKLPALGTDAGRWQTGQSAANGLLFLGRQAFQKFDDLQSNCTHL
jgi:hypothetical protein